MTCASFCDVIKLMPKKRTKRVTKKKFHLRKFLPWTLLASALVIGAFVIPNNLLNKNQTTKSAVPAQPFPGEQMPAIPAIPAMQKPKTENTIAIHAPAGGAGWVRGQTLTFMPIEWSWNLKGNAEKFTINLLKGGILYKQLATVDVNSKGQLPADQWSWDWHIPLDTPTDSDYKIEVSTTLGKQKISAVNFLPFAILGETVTVKGRFVDKYTKEPVSGITMAYYSDPNDRVAVNANGEFAYTVSTDPSRYITKSYLYGASCYMQGYVTTNHALGASPIYPDTFNANQVANFYTFDTYSQTRFGLGDYTIKPILGDTVAIEPQMWPASNVQIISDVPVKAVMYYYQSDASIPDYFFDINYPQSYSSTEGYSLTPLLKDAVPADYSIRVLLKDQAGNKYVSPFYRMGGAKCKTATLNFANKEFQWGVAQ